MTEISSVSCVGGVSRKGMVSPNVPMAEVTIEQQPPLPFLLLRRVSLKLQRDSRFGPTILNAGYAISRISLTSIISRTNKLAPSCPAGASFCDNWSATDIG